MELIKQKTSDSRAMHRGFTLVELLVVITIIGILASLITVAAVGALKRAQQARTKIETDQISEAVVNYQLKYNSYPPNGQVDDQDDTTASEPPNAPLNELQVLSDLKLHFRRAFSRFREDDNLLRAL